MGPNYFLIIRGGAGAWCLTTDWFSSLRNFGASNYPEMIIIYVEHFVTGLQHAQKTVPGAQITFIDVYVENNGQ